VEPKGVKFPGAYKRTDAGVNFNLYTGGQAAKDNYVRVHIVISGSELTAEQVIPGPSIYRGKFEASAGSPFAITLAQKGLFPDAAFQAKYDDFKKRYYMYAMKSADSVNLGQPGTKSKSVMTSADAQIYAQSRSTEMTKFNKEMEELKAMALKLGYVRA
jgi:hypothetical protein